MNSLSTLWAGWWSQTLVFSRVRGVECSGLRSCAWRRPVFLLACIDISKGKAITICRVEGDAVSAHSGAIMVWKCSSYRSPIHVWSILILSTHLRLCVPSGVFTSGFYTKTVYTFVFSPIRTTCPAHLILTWNLLNVALMVNVLEMWRWVCGLWPLVKCNVFVLRGFLLGMLLPRRCRHYLSFWRHLLSNLPVRVSNLTW